MPTTDRLNSALAGRYRIERELGAGGMATVYLAEDLKHDRKVAIKVLKPELAAVLGAERFVVEIKTTAALQHPHILPLFDSGTADGFLFYVMPYIQGETIREKLNRESQFGVDEAVRIAREVADALDYAHRHGVIHRDIKPENILLHDGRAMVMDFGIALAVSAAAGGRMTETGLSLGTPHYMSPEQATADKDITARSDQYSLACVLYEMLGGSPPHMGGNAQQIIMRIITDAARPVTDLRKSVPPNVDAALARALEKVPADRFESTKAFADALGASGFTYSTHTRAHAYAGQGAQRSRRPALIAASAAMLVLVGVAGGAAFGKRGHEERSVVRFPLALPGSLRITTNINDDAPFALSPDGKMIAMVLIDSTGSRLYVQSFDALAPVPLAGTEGAVAPFFAPDGKSIGFSTRPAFAMKKVATTGGPVTTLAKDVGNVEAGSWGDDNRIVFTTQAARLARVSSTGGASSQIPVQPADSLNYFYWPSVLPGSKYVLAELCGSYCNKHDLVAVEVATGKITVLEPNGTRGWYAPSGHLVYGTQDRSVFAVRFNPRTLAVSGEPIPLLQGLEETARHGLRLSIASASGSMVYRPGGSAASGRIVAVDRNGRERTVIAKLGNYTNPRWSPDRKRIAIQFRSDDGVSQIWIYDGAQETFTQLTREGDHSRPTWSPDGKMIAFVGAGGLWSMPADGSSPPDTVLATADGGLAPNWTRDGKWITIDGALVRTSPSEDVYAVPVTGKRVLQPVVTTQGNDQLGAVSPDGKWIAYNSDESDGYKVYIRPFQAPGGRYLISKGLGVEPLWISNTALVYVDGDAHAMVLAELQLGAAVQVASRTRLFDADPYSVRSNSVWNYDVARDGSEFLFVRPEQNAVTLPPIVVLNWASEIARKAAEQGGRK
ncbi:MAG TPA: protein kinase [Gemmatimonadaceae bacterium]|nr:protein kinase [Gemmatimonadaceae bacterium]